MGKRPNEKLGWLIARVRMKAVLHYMLPIKVESFRFIYLFYTIQKTLSVSSLILTFVRMRSLGRVRFCDLLFPPIFFVPFHSLHFFFLIYAHISLRDNKNSFQPNDDTIRYEFWCNFAHPNANKIVKSKLMFDACLCLQYIILYIYITYQVRSRAIS